MTREQLGATFKTKAEEIGLEYWETKPERPYRSDDFLFTFEWIAYNTHCDTTAKHLQLLATFAELGITRDMLSHIRCVLGRGKAWPSFYCGIKGEDMERLLKSERI